MKNLYATLKPATQHPASNRFYIALLRMPALKLLLILALLVGGRSLGWGQISISNTSPVTENFDAMGTSSTASLPSNWKLSVAGATSPTWSAAGNFTAVSIQASSGSPTGGGRYNWGTSTTERAAGIMTSGSYASPNSLMAYYRNTSVSNITGLTISYDLERYRINSAAASVQFYYSTDGSTWTPVTAGDIAAASLPTGTSTYNFAPSGTPSATNCGVISKTGISITGLNIASNSDIYLRWNLVTTGSNSQGIGIDNVSVTATISAGSDPNLAITGTTSHGSVCPSTAASTIQYTITNSGTLEAAGVSVTSNDPQFVVSGLSSNSIAASGGTATYNVTFTPSSVGSKSATITVASTTSGSNSPTSSLSGTGTAPVTPVVNATTGATLITAQGATLNGNVTTIGVCPALNEKGFVYSVTTTNGNPSVGGDGVTKVVVASGTITTGAYTNILTGLPSSTGYTYKSYVYDGTTYTYSASAPTFNTSAALTISGTTNNGTTCAGVAASPQTYTITNNGAIQVDGIAAVSGGTNATDFVVSSLSSTSIAAGGTATYLVTFTPSSSGSKSATITVSSTTSGIVSATSSLTGAGSTPVTQAVSTSAATSVAGTTATLNGNLTAVGVCPATTEKGFVYSVTSVNSDPLVLGTGVTTTSVSGVSTGTYLLALTGLPNGTQYSFKAYVYNGTTYTYGSLLTFTTTTPPANDLCSGAQVIPASGPFPYLTTVVDNTNATSTGDPIPSCQSNYGNGIWYTIAPSVSGKYSFSTCSSETSTTISDDVMSLYSGLCGSLTDVACNDDGGFVCTGSLASISAELTAGTTYYIMVSGYSTNVGNIQIKVRGPLLAPIASPASNVTSNSFTANWGSVTGAENYRFELSTNSNFGSGTLSNLTEGFETGLTGSYTNGSLTLGSGVWSFADAGLKATGAGTFNSGLAACQVKATTGTVTTPALNNVGTMTFYAKSPSGTTVTIKKIVSGVTTTVTTRTITSTWTQYSVDINEYNTGVQIVIANGSNFYYLDDVTLNYGFIPSFVSGYNGTEVISGTSKSVTGISPNTTYYYRARSVSSTTTNSPSVYSNVMPVLTTPGAFNVTGGGSYCAEGLGVAVGLDGSQTGVNYQLYNGASTVGSPIAGTGSALSFGNQKAEGTYTVKGTNAGGTTDMTGSATVTINALPTAVITGDATICSGSSTNLSVALTGAQPWSITYTDGTTPVTVSGITSSPKTITVSPSTATTYTLTAVNDANCTGTSYTGSAVVTVEPTPVAGTLTKTPDALSVCEGNSVSATLTAGTGGNGNDELQYRTNNGSEWTSWLDYTSGASILTTGLTNVEIQTRRLATTCSSSAYTTVSWIVNSNLPVSVSIESSDADNTICDGTSVIFTATPTNGGASPTFQWKLNGSYVGSGTNTYTNDALVDQDKVSVVLTSNATCASGSPATSNEIATTVNPNQPVSVSISSSDVDNTICDGTSVIFTATPTNGGASPTYQWKLNGSDVGSGTNTYANDALVDQDKVTVVLTSNATCATGSPATSNEIATTVNTAITPTFAAVGPYCAGASIPALPTTSTNGITGSWSPAINNTATTEYTFTPDAGQCATTTTLTITINSNTTPTFAAVGPYCSGASIDALPTTSTNGITGTWSPVINNTTTTEYTFTPTAGQCATTATLTITINSSPTADAGTGVGIGLGVAYTLSGTATNYTSVLWTIETGGSSENGIFDDATKLNAKFTGNTLGTINLRLTATGGCGVASSDITMVVLPTEPVNWKGTAANNNWNNPDNWFSASVPDENTDVYIPANAPKFPTVTATAACRDIEIAAGASLIDNANYLTVHGTATVNHPAIINGRWHLISSPVSNAKSGMYTGQYLRNFITSTGKYEPVYSTTEVLTPAKGFALWTTASNSTAYVGSTLNSGTQSFALSGAGDRWNLVGNPYPSSIDWSIAAGFDKSDIDNAIYVVNYTGWNTYVDGVGTPGTFGPQIAPTQGFFVRANSTSGGTFQINNNARVHNNTTFYKKADGTVPNLVRLKVSGNGYADEAVVRFKPEATADFDGDYDAVKMFGDVAAAAQLYSLGTTPLAINSLPETELVSVGIHVGTAGSYTIEATEINDLNYVTLEDAVTGIFTPLSGSSYTFDATPGDYNNRFKLHFSMLSVEEAQKATAEVYSYQHTIYINIKDQQKGDIFVYNISGQLVKTIPSARGNNEIKVAVGGNYIVKVVGKDNTSVKKVWIQQ